jgi:hypothetical protein
MAEHAVEYSDLLLVEAIGIIQEEIGDTPQRLDPLLGRAAADRSFKLLKER